jgi:hypothetical protein
MQEFYDNSKTPPNDANIGLDALTKNIKKPYLINKLNYINFQDGFIQVVFEHSQYKSTVSLNAKPLPCLGESLECVWPDSAAASYKEISSYKFKEIQIPNGKNVIIVKPRDVFISGKSANFLLPEVCFELMSRQTRRYSCNDIHAQVIQNGVTFEGKLMDFNLSFFQVEILKHGKQAFFWINNESSISLILTGENGMIFAGDCRIVQIRNRYKTKKNFIVEPMNQKISRFSKKDYRASRFELIPSPYVIFTHPFSNKKKSLSILDISGSGFSVKEDRETAMLIPGMILPEIEIHLGNSFSVSCKAQIVHRTIPEQQDRDGYIKTGLAILDMGVEDHGKILSLLHQAKNPHLYLDGKINEDDLWRFFFETGFIYPSKYKFIQENKEELKTLYKKIYSDSPKIAKHFLYRDNGEILGHMAIIRFYRKSWMIQHHASYKNASWLAGIEVLDEMGRFVNESGSLLSMNMDYVFCYYRAENKFPNQLFGGAAKSITQPKICSEDSFSYFHYRKVGDKPSVELKIPWSLLPSQQQDLIELKEYYNSISGGIMIDALELLPEYMEIGELKEEYTNLELKRDKFLYTLKKENRLVAVFMVNLADIGLNFSDITNSIHIFLIEKSLIDAEILERVLCNLSKHFNIKEIPILLYPQNAVDKLHIVSEKIYRLCVMDARNLDYYFEFMKKYFRRLNSIKSRNA